MIEPRKQYRIKTDSEYFKNKYGEAHPVIIIEGEHRGIFGGWWGWQQGNPACLCYAMRSVSDNLPDDNPRQDEVFYGKICGMGELVHESELELIEE